MYKYYFSLLYVMQTGAQPAHPVRRAIASGLLIMIASGSVNKYLPGQADLALYNCHSTFQ